MNSLLSPFAGVRAVAESRLFIEENRLNIQSRVGENILGTLYYTINDKFY